MMIRFKRLIACGLALAATALGSTAYALTDLTRPVTDTSVTELIEGSATNPDPNNTYGFQPKLLFDNSWGGGSAGDDSRWMGKFASGTTTFFTYGFKTATVVNAVRLRVPAYYCNARAPKRWTIYGSLDNSDWTQIHEQTDADGEWAAQESRIYCFENSVAYKYYKIVVNEIRDSTQFWAQLNEVEFYRMIRWTGAIDNDVANPENWEGNQVPGADADVCFAGDAVPNIPAGASFAVASVYAQNVTLADNLDWSGLSVPVDGTIDLKGHDLTVSQLAGNCTITDSSEFYEQLEYIESTGAQFVNTGYKPNDKTVVEASFNVKTRTVAWGEFFGCTSDDGALSKKYPPPAGYEKAWDVYRCRWYNQASQIQGSIGGKSSTVDISSGSDLDIKLENGKFTVNGTEHTFTSAKEYTETLDLYVFGCNCPCPWGDGTENRAKNSNSSNLYRAQAMKLYSFKITENGVVKRNFVPVKRTRDGKVGLLDLANPGANEFYVNKGSGADFTAGAATGVTHGSHGGELHVNVASGTVTGSAKLTGTATLVKDGEGTFKWNGGANSVATTCPVVITNGVFGFDTNDNDVFGNGGRITIAGKGQMDVSKKSSNGDGAYSPVLNRTLYIEGEGPDGSGAITRSVSGGKYGYHLKVVNLTGDATIGGKSRIDFRGNNCRLYGHGFTLTVKNTAMLSFCDGNTGIDGLAALVLSDGGKYEPCQNASGPFGISGGIVLNGGVLGPWANSSTGTYAISNPVTVGEGGGTITSDQGTISFAGDVTVLEGCTAAVSKSIKFANVEVGEGATLSSADATAKTITGTLSGGGTVSGANIAFSGTATRWAMAANAGGWTSKADLTGANANALAALKAIDITYAGITSAELEIGPALGLTATTLPLLTVKTEDGNEIASTLAIKEDGKLYVRIDLDAVATATWTGAKGDGGVKNPENWDCKNALGGTVADGLPGLGTTVTFTGDKIPSIQTDSEFTAKNVVLSDAMLANDCDWSGLAATILVSGKIDLKGNKLTVANLPATWTAEITDSNATGAGGELHLSVASGATVENTSVTLSGSLKLVKEGAGTFKATKSNQTYTGGTVVSEGTLVYGTGSYPVGPKGKTVTVAAGATLNMNGILNTTSCIYNYDLAGTVQQYSTGDGWSDGCRCFGDITLSGDATIIGKGYFFANPTKTPGLITFNGHTLTFDIVDAQGNGVYSAFGAWRDDGNPGGTIKVLRGSFEGSKGYGCTSTRLVVGSGVTFKVAGSFDVGGLEYRSSSWVSNKGTPCLKVYGRYLVGSMRPRLDMQTGSTLDLSEVAGAWSTDGKAPTNLQPTTNTFNEPGRVTFANGATITIDLGTRTDTGDHGKIIAWSSIPTGVTFKRAEGVVGRLVVKEDGLYLIRGLMLIFH